MPSLYVSNKEFAIVEIRMGLNLTFFFKIVVEKSWALAAWKKFLAILFIKRAQIPGTIKKLYIFKEKSFIFCFDLREKLGGGSIHWETQLMKHWVHQFQKHLRRWSPFKRTFGDTLICIRMWIFLIWTKTDL